MADRAKDAAGNASTEMAALIRELLGEVERLKADIDRLKGWPVAVKTAKDEAIEELTAEVERLTAERGDFDRSFRESLREIRGGGSKDLYFGLSLGMVRAAHLVGAITYEETESLYGEIESAVKAVKEPLIWTPRPVSPDPRELAGLTETPAATPRRGD